MGMPHPKLMLLPTPVDHSNDNVKTASRMRSFSLSASSARTRQRSYSLGGRSMFSLGESLVDVDIDRRTTRHRSPSDPGAYLPNQKKHTPKSTPVRGSFPPFSNLEPLSPPPVIDLLSSQILPELLPTLKIGKDVQIAPEAPHIGSISSATSSRRRRADRNHRQLSLPVSLPGSLECRFVLKNLSRTLTSQPTMRLRSRRVQQKLLVYRKQSNFEKISEPCVVAPGSQNRKK